VHVDDGRARVERSLAERGLELIAAHDGGRPAAVRPGERLEIGLRQHRLAVDVDVEKLLPLADHAQALVVDHQHLDGQIRGNQR